MQWRQVLAHLLNAVLHSDHAVSPILQPDCDSLRSKLPYIYQRLRFSATDHGALQSEYWLSGDEVVCALALLDTPCSLWMHSAALALENPAGILDSSGRIETH